MTAHAAAHSAIITPRPAPWIDLLNPVRMVANLWSRRDLIRQFSAREVTSRHRGSHLGMFWAFLSPLLLLAVYTLVFSTILNVRFRRAGSESVLVYALTLFTGMMVFHIFSEPLARAPSLVAGRPNFVKKMVFPIEIFPISAFIASTFYSVAGLVVVFAAYSISKGHITHHALLFPLVFAPLYLVGLGVCWILAALGVFLRDLQQLVAVLVQRILFFITPIFYPLEAVPPEHQWILHLNPLTVVVDGSRRTLLWGEYPQWWPLLTWTAIGLVVAPVGYAFFLKSKRGFADVL